MTVHLREGKGTIPLWAAVTLIITILLGASGYVMYAVQRGADADHRLYAQEIHQLSDELMTKESIDVSQTAAISDMKSDIAVIKEKVTLIERILRTR